MWRKFFDVTFYILLLKEKYFSQDCSVSKKIMEKGFIFNINLSSVKSSIKNFKWWKLSECKLSFNCDKCEQIKKIPKREKAKVTDVSPLQVHTHSKWKTSTKMSVFRHPNAEKITAKFATPKQQAVSKHMPIYEYMCEAFNEEASFHPAERYLFDIEEIKGLKNYLSRKPKKANIMVTLNAP